MITEQHPVIVKIIGDRKKAVVVGSLAAALATLNAVLGDGPLWLVAVPTVFVLIAALDIWCIRQRVRSGAYGDNFMEVTEVARAVEQIKQSIQGENNAENR